MIKTAAALAVALGFALGGKCVASFYAGRFAHLTVEQLLRELDKNGGFVYLDFIADCRRRMESGEPFPSAWRKSIEQRGELCRLLGEAKEYLAALGSGATDVDGQLNSCGYYKRLLTAELEQREEKNRRSSKLFPALGVMLGVSAAIMMI